MCCKYYLTLDLYLFYSILVAARTLSNIGRSDIAWGFLRTLFSGQGENGIMPRFVYLNHTDVYGNKVDGVGWVDFVGLYPGPKLLYKIKPIIS